MSLNTYTRRCSCGDGLYPVPHGQLLGLLDSGNHRLTAQVHQFCVVSFSGETTEAKQSVGYDWSTVGNALMAANVHVISERKE